MKQWLKTQIKRWLGHNQQEQLIAEIQQLRQETHALRLKVTDIRKEQARWRIADLERFTQTLLDRPRYQDQRALARYEHQVFSQSGEDGIIAEIFRRIGTTNRFFVEIGVGNGLQNNTSYLLLQGWHGTWIEGDEHFSIDIRQHFAQQLETGQLKLHNAFVTAENVADLFQQAQIPTQFDFLSLDIDRNTYWVWKALKQYRPRAICIEYNAIFPPAIDWKVTYQANRLWDKSSYFGASLLALERLGAEMGYALVGCSLSGINAFFVRQDLCNEQLFLPPFTAGNHYEPHRAYLIHRIGRPRHFHDDPTP